MAYLDKTGLLRLWSKIKTYVSGNYAAKSHSHAVATTSTNGLMSKEDKAKLNKIGYVFGIDETGPYIEEI